MIHLVDDKFQFFDFKEQDATLRFYVDDEAELITIQTSDLWFEADLIYGGNKDYSLNIHLDENFAKASRRATITITSDFNGRITRNYFGIEQSWNDAILEFVNQSEVVATIADTYTTFLNVQGINAIQYRCNDSWVSNFVIPQNNLHILRFDVASNNGGKRTATIEAHGYDASGYEVAYTKLDVVQLANSHTQTAYIAFNPQNRLVDYLGEHNSVEFNYLGIDLNTLTFWSDETWITNIQFDSATNTLTYDVLANTTNIRSGVINAKASTPFGDGLYDTFEITQAETPEFIEFPIWKDTDVELVGDGEYIDYRFVIDANIIFNGRAVLFDGKATLNVNTILRDWLQDNIDLMQQGWQQSSLYVIAELQVSDTEWVDYSTYKSLRFYYDYTYDENYTNYLTQTIENYVDRNQTFTFSFIDRSDDTPLTITIYISYKDGTESVENHTIYNGIYTYVNTDLHDIVKININNQYVYHVVDGCNKYNLLWLNKLGGWNTALFDGRAKQTDSFTFNTIKNRVNNTTLKHGKRIWQNDIIEKWELTSNRLNDKQAEILADAFGSTKMYLQDLQSGKIIPIICSSSSVEHLLFKNNSNKRIVYKLQVENSQDRIRR